MLYTLRLEPTEATLDVVRERLGLGEGDIDESFGVVCIDPADSKYAILVEESALPPADGAPSVGGPYSNPVIEPFGELRSATGSVEE
jgi:hypothetical protein